MHKLKYLNLIIMLPVFLLTAFHAFATPPAVSYRLSGTVTNQEGEPLPGVYVAISPGKKTTVTDTEGKFTFLLPEGSYTIECQQVGMRQYTEKIKLTRDLHLTISLDFSDVNLDQVIITAKPSMDVNSVSMGSTYMDSKTLNKLPALLGEVDVIRSVTTLPGVVSAGEGSSGFYVRGGSADQNLILLDDAPVFNSSHLFGFFSVYNPDALKSYTLQRSGISARYGSRISSILDVNLKDGNDEKLRFSTGISPVTAKIGIDGPVTSKSTMLLAARAAYPIYILKLFPSKDIKNSSGYFYDANFKYKYTFNQNNYINLSTYYSQDGFKFPYDTLYNWSNTLGSLKWNHVFNEHLGSSLTLVKSIYHNNVEGIAVGEEFILKSGIDFTQAKIDFAYSGWQDQVLDFGSGVSDYVIQPGQLDTYGNSSLNPATLQIDKGREHFAYLNDEITFSSKLSLALGLRYSYFVKRGAGDVYLYEPDKPKSVTNLTDTLHYADGEAMQDYQELEPRASMKYSLNSHSSVKLGYSRTSQYIQLISNTTSITPVDVWKLSNNYIKPQLADQFSVGYFSLQQDLGYEFSWEVYYKKLQQQIDYKDGAVILLNPTLEADLLFGTGTAYGSEWLLKKNSGRLTGWISLSYSRSFRTIQGMTKAETINNGIQYPSNYDKPVNLNIFMNYQLANPQWSFSANFTYSTGRPITASDSWYNYYGTIYANYQGRNQERMPDYHRLDLAFNYNAKPGKKVETSWSITLYNLYFRNNAYSTIFKHYYGSLPGAYKLAIIGIPIPSVSFNMKF